MKTQPNRNRRANRAVPGSPPVRSSGLRSAYAENPYTPRITPYPRYPSLAGDFEARSERSRENLYTTTKSAASSSNSVHWEIPYVRILALLLIIAIIVALAANV